MQIQKKKKEKSTRFNVTENVRISWRKPAEANTCGNTRHLKSQMSNQGLTVERRDRRKSYNLMTVADLQKKLTPSIEEYILLPNRFEKR
jgi:hypothetical protein